MVDSRIKGEILFYGDLLYATTGQRFNRVQTVCRSYGQRKKPNNLPSKCLDGSLQFVQIRTQSQPASRKVHDLSMHKPQKLLTIKELQDSLDCPNMKSLHEDLMILLEAQINFPSTNMKFLHLVILEIFILTNFLLKFGLNFCKLLLL